MTTLKPTAYALCACTGILHFIFAILSFISVLVASLAYPIAFAEQPAPLNGVSSTLVANSEWLKDLGWLNLAGCLVMAASTWVRRVGDTARRGDCQ